MTKRRELLIAAHERDDDVDGGSHISPRLWTARESAAVLYLAERIDDAWSPVAAPMLRGHLCRVLAQHAEV
jgi:hypothetical protein